MVEDDDLVCGVGWYFVFWLEVALTKGFKTIVSFDFDEVLTLSIRLEMISLLLHRIDLHCFLRKICLTLLPIVMTFSFIARLHDIA